MNDKSEKDVKGSNYDLFQGSHSGLRKPMKTVSTVNVTARSQMVHIPKYKSEALLPEPI
jgi:hypothetical protein